LSDGVSDPAAALPGAEPFAFPGGAGPNGRTGVLLVHGFTGTPMSLRSWGEHLAAEGFAVRCPLLPGHGTRWQDCNAVDEEAWVAAAQQAFDALAAECDQVFVAGLSMGGTVSIRLAELRPDDVAGLVVVNPSLLTRRLDARLIPVLARVTGSWAPIGNDIKKPGIVELAYDRMPLRGMMSLRRLWRTARADLHRVTAPVLAFTSVEDHVVEPESTDVLLDGVSSADVTQVKLENSYHVATLDNDAPLIFAGSVDWIRARVPGRETTAADSAAAESP
jgi:esterase/lipase